MHGLRAVFFQPTRHGELLVVKMGHVGGLQRREPAELPWSHFVVAVSLAGMPGVYIWALDVPA